MKGLKKSLKENKDFIEELPKAFRFELIDHRENAKSVGRVFTTIDPNLKVQVSVQDDGRTLKVFLS